MGRTSRNRISVSNLLEPLSWSLVASIPRRGNKALCRVLRKPAWALISGRVKSPLTRQLTRLHRFEQPWRTISLTCSTNKTCSTLGWAGSRERAREESVVFLRFVLPPSSAKLRQKFIIQNCGRAEYKFLMFIYEIYQNYI